MRTQAYTSADDTLQLSLSEPKTLPAETVGVEARTKERAFNSGRTRSSWPRGRRFLTCCNDNSSLSRVVRHGTRTRMNARPKLTWHTTTHSNAPTKSILTWLHTRRGKKPMNYSLTLLNHYYWNALANGQSRLLGRTSVNL